MTSRFDVRSRRLARALRQQTLLTVSSSATYIEKKCKFQAVASIIARGRFMLRNLCTCSQYAVMKIWIHYIPLNSWMASSPKADIKKYFSWKLYATNITISLTFYGSWISGKGSATTANYNYMCNTLLTQTETGRAVAVSTKGVLYYAASNQEHMA